MRFAAFLPIAIAALYIGCEDADSNADINTLFENACSSPDPLLDVEWLQEIKNSLEPYDAIVQGKYLSETVFYVIPICINCSMVPPTPTLYDCSGTIIKKFNENGSDQDDLIKLKMERILFHNCC
jgi:hypothetical protein